jgi:hypothetical protein
LHQTVNDIKTVLNVTVFFGTVKGESMQNAEIPIIVFDPPFEWEEIEGVLYKKLDSGLLVRVTESN